MLLKLSIVHTIDLNDLGAREAVEKRIARDIPAELPHLGPSRKGIPERQEACVGRHGETRAAVAEADSADKMLAHGGVARIVLGGAAVGHGDVAPETAVDVVHHAAKQGAVGRLVLELAREDAVVNHLVENDVIELVLGQVEERGDAQDEALVAASAEEAALAAISNLPQETARTA